MRIRRLQPLLFRQTALLMLVAGAGAVLHPALGLSVCALLLWGDSRAWKPMRFCLLLACAGAGVGLAFLRVSVAVSEPEMLFAQPHVRLSGRVSEVKGLPDRRIRIVVDNPVVQLVQAESKPDAVKTAGRIMIKTPGEISGNPPYQTSDEISGEAFLENSTQIARKISGEMLGETSGVAWGRASHKNPAQTSGKVQDVTPGEVPDKALVEYPYALSGKVAWTWENPSRRPVSGEYVEAVVRLRRTGGFHNSGGSDLSLYWRLQNVSALAWSRGGECGEPIITGTGFSAAMYREKLRTMLVDALERLYPPAPYVSSYTRAVPATPHGWGALPALLFGDRFYMSSEDTQRMGLSGLAHSLALSGQHLAVAGLAGCFLVALLGKMAPGIFLIMPRYKLLLLASLPPAAVYLWLGDAPPSLIRAALMLAAWALFCCWNRPTALGDGLIAALVCMTVVQPANLGDLGLQLSFSAVGGIVLIVPVLESAWAQKNDPGHKTTGLGKVGKLLLATLLCSLAVQLATLPLTLRTFGMVSPWFFLNLVWLPLLGLWILPLAFVGFFCLSLGASSLGDWLLLGALEPCHWLFSGLAWLDSQKLLEATWALRPHWSALPGFTALLIAVVAAAGQRRLHSACRRLALAGVALLLVGPALRVVDGLSDEVRLRVLDVGQAQSVLVEWPGQGRALVDGGGFASPRFDSGRDLLFPLLTDNRPPRLDVIALSHPDTDHLRGLLFVARHTNLRFALLAKGVVQKPQSSDLKAFLDTMRQNDVPVREHSAGGVIALGAGLTFEVVAPEPGTVPSRNEGLVLRLLREGKGLALLPGDMEGPSLRRLLRTGQDLRAQALLAPHHGSARSLVPAFYDAIAPRFVLASCGNNNRFGFPSVQVRQALAARGIPFHTTAEEGELRVVWAGGGGPGVLESREMEMEKGMNSLNGMLESLRNAARALFL